MAVEPPQIIMAAQPRLFSVATPQVITLAERQVNTVVEPQAIILAEPQVTTALTTALHPRVCDVVREEWAQSLNGPRGRVGNVQVSRQRWQRFAKLMSGLTNTDSESNMHVPVL